MAANWGLVTPRSCETPPTHKGYDVHAHANLATLAESAAGVPTWLDTRQWAGQVRNQTCALAIETASGTRQ